MVTGWPEGRAKFSQVLDSRDGRGESLDRSRLGVGELSFEVCFDEVGFKRCRGFKSEGKKGRRTKATRESAGSSVWA